MKLKFLYFFIAIILLHTQVAAQVPIPSEWKTVDDETGVTKSVVRIYKSDDGKHYGKVMKVLDTGRGTDPSCANCPDDEYRTPGMKVVGMLVITEMEMQNGELVNGKILDPEKGKEYNCKIWMDGSGNLNVRGYWGVFYRTQVWYRM